MPKSIIGSVSVLVALGCCFLNATISRAATPPGMLGMAVKMDDGWLTITAVHDSFPASRSEPVQWKGNKIVSRVLPYPDLNSLFIRLPIAHAAATGKGVKVAVLGLSEDKRVLSLLQTTSWNG